MSYSTHHFYPNSKYKNNTGLNNEILVRGPDFQNIYKFRIVSAYFPHSFYSVNSNNNTLIIRKNGDTLDRTATIPIGDYTFSELSIVLKNQMDGLAGPAQTYTIVEDSQHNNKIKITQNSLSFIIKSSGTSNFALGLSTTNDTNDLIEHIGEHSYDLSYTKIIKVYCKQLTTHFTKIETSGNDSHDLLFYVPINSIYGGIIEYRPKSPLNYDWTDWSGGQELEIILRDDQDKLLGGNTGLNHRNWHMHLEFFSIRKNHPNHLEKITHRYSENGGGDVYN